MCATLISPFRSKASPTKMIMDLIHISGLDTIWISFTPGSSLPRAHETLREDQYVLIEGTEDALADHYPPLIPQDRVDLPRRFLRSRNPRLPSTSSTIASGTRRPSGSTLPGSNAYLGAPHEAGRHPRAGWPRSPRVCKPAYAAAPVPPRFAAIARLRARQLPRNHIRGQRLLGSLARPPSRASPPSSGDCVPVGRVLVRLLHGPGAGRRGRAASSDILLWFERYAASPIEAGFRPNKHELWLHLALLDSSRDRRDVFLRRVFPASLPAP